MTCQELDDFLFDYISDALSEEQRILFEEHLQGCLDCTSYLDSYRKAIHATRTAVRAGESLPQAVPQGLIEAVLRSRLSR